MSKLSIAEAVEILRRDYKEVKDTPHAWFDVHKDTAKAVLSQIKQLQAELTEAKSNRTYADGVFKAALDYRDERIERAASYTGFEGYACPLCEYNDGVFIKFCALHERIDQQSKRIEQLREALERHGEHSTVCGKDRRGYCTNENLEFEGDSCTCGFEQALKT